MNENLSFSVFTADIVSLLLLGTLSTCIFSVSPRYHYPFFFAAIIWAAYWLDLNTAKLEKV